MCLGFGKMLRRVVVLGVKLKLFSKGLIHLVTNFTPLISQQHYIGSLTNFMIEIKERLYLTTKKFLKKLEQQLCFVILPPKFLAYHKQAAHLMVELG